MNLPATTQLPLICSSHGIATASIFSNNSVTFTVGHSTQTISLDAAQDLAKALTACLARLVRLREANTKAPDPTPTAPPSGWTEPARLAA